MWQSEYLDPILSQKEFLAVNTLRQSTHPLRNTTDICLTNDTKAQKTKYVEEFLCICYTNFNFIAG